jgi:hypothetical protein
MCGNDEKNLKRRLHLVDLNLNYKDMKYKRRSIDRIFVRNFFADIKAPEIK